MTRRNCPRIKPRRRYHRAFLAWLAANRHRLSIDLAFRGRTDGSMQFSFVGIIPALSVSLSRYDLSIHVTWQEEFWDCLADWDSAPMRFAWGYACTLCRDNFRHRHPDDEFAAVFRSKAGVWAHDIFEPFLEWVNYDLANARVLRLSSYHGATWARLVTAQNEQDERRELRTRALIDALRRPCGDPGGGA